jgi:hypothetical protein
MIMPFAERIDKRINIFHEDVKLPECAAEPSVLPDNLIEHCKAVFGQKNKRGIFPLHLLDMRWVRCVKCQAIHARVRCPTCGAVIAEAPEETQEAINAKDLFKRIIDPLGLSEAGKVAKFGVKEAAWRIADPLGLFTRRPKKS